MNLRPAIAEDLPHILDLNQKALPHVSSVGLSDIQRFFELAAYFKVINDAENAIKGFLIGLRPGLDYTSDNYRWFNNNFEDFLYIDRIVIAEDSRGLGLGSVLYNDAIEIARLGVPRLTCEVNSLPPNPQSMSFHENLGFVPVGSQQTEGGTKEVTLLSLELDQLSIS
jgi:uncharacterized protein